jgi:hypothetical protein
MEQNSHTSDPGPRGTDPKHARVPPKEGNASRVPRHEPLPGVQVTEFEATLPIEIYGELFPDRL